MAHGRHARGQLGQGVAGHDPVEIGVAQAAYGIDARSDEQVGSGTWAVDHGGKGGRLVGPDGVAQDLVDRPVEGLDEDVDGAPAGEADGEGVLVGDPVGEERGRPGLEHAERLGEHGALHAATGDGTGHLAVLAHGHRRTGQARARALDADDAGQRHPFAGRVPALDVVEDLSHRFPITSTNRSMAASEWPSTKSSM